MPKGTILFIHGTGVRLKDYQHGFNNAQKCAESAGIDEVFSPCLWGDPLGVEFKGLSLPGTQEKIEEGEAVDFAQWNWLFEAPLWELDKMTIADPARVGLPDNPSQKPKWLSLWEQIEAYRITDDLRALLQREGLEELWIPAWEAVMYSSIPKVAFEASAGELPEACRALARAVIAQLHVLAVSKGFSGPSGDLRRKLLARLLADWGQQVFGLGAMFESLVKRVGTKILKNHRLKFSGGTALPVGDVLLYQSRGEGVRNFIRERIEKAEPPVTVVAHSLGGIACVDLLAGSNPPEVWRLVTAGSQAPLLYEMHALGSLKPPNPLPKKFPRWLNFYDRNDFLSYVAERLLPPAKDIEVKSGQPFPDSHSAYFGNPEVWQAVRRFIDEE